MKQAIALVSLLALVAISGCLESGDGSPQPVDNTDAVAPTDLEPGFYQFHHRGGPLAFAVDADQRIVFDLYGGDDERLGRIHIGHGGVTDALELDVAAGDLVARFLEIDSDLEHEALDEPGDENATHEDAEPIERAHVRVHSGGRAVEQFWRLGTQVERHIIVNGYLEESQVNELLFDAYDAVQQYETPIDDVVNITLHRTPYAMDVLVSGKAEDLELSILGNKGPVYEATGVNIVSTGGGHLRPIPGDFIHQNVVDGQFTVQFSSSNQEGTLLLQTRTYSRVMDAPAADATWVSTDSPGNVLFTYGELPSRPVFIEVHPDAEMLHFWTEQMVPDSVDVDQECEIGEPCSGQHEETEPVTARFALYTPSNQKLGHFTVESGQRLDVPVHLEGLYVLVPHGGPVWVGADEAPRDFEFHPAETRTQTVGRHPGESGRYGVQEANLTDSGAAYAVSLRNVEGNIDNNPNIFFDYCHTPGTIQVLIDGESIGFGGDISGGTMDRVNRLIQPHTTTFFADGYDGRCGDFVLDVHTFHR